jgi:hypothetical protein
MFVTILFVYNIGGTPLCMSGSEIRFQITANHLIQFLLLILRTEKILQLQKQYHKEKKKKCF